MKINKHYVTFFIISLLLILADQYSKIIAKNKLENGDPFYIIKNVLCLDYVINKGAAWGIFQNKISMFLIFTLVTLAFLIYIYVRCPKNRYYLPLRLCLCLIFSGAIGNMIDRSVRGFVIDFIYVEIINFPVFNIADSYITVATFLLFFLLLFKYKNDDDFSFLKIKHGKKL